MSGASAAMPLPGLADLVPPAVSRPSARRVEASNTTADSLAGIDLVTAVPVAVEMIGGWSPARRAKEADGYADAIAFGADVLWADLAGARHAEIGPDRVRDAIVHGLALLAHRPAGISFAGLHWHAGPQPCDDCPTAGTAPLPLGDLLRGGARDARGAFFTPPALADEVTRYALGPHLHESNTEHIASLSVADIACGSGAFLLAAARQLAAAHLSVWTDYDRAWYTAELAVPDPAAAAMTLAVHCLYGVDIDPLSIELTHLVLALVAPHADAGGLRRRVRVGDALLGHGQPWLRDAPVDLPTWPNRLDWPIAFPEVFDAPSNARGFDAVIGNPPYLGGQKLAGTFGEPYRQHLITNIAQGRRGPADLAVYFWLRMHELVSELGTVGVVGPTNLTRGGNLRVWDDHLRQVGHRTIYRREELRRWPSRSAAVRCCLLYTTCRLWIDPLFRDPDVHDEDPGGGHVHTCGFDTDPPRLGERWPLRPDCPRCQHLATTVTTVIRTAVDGSAYEIVQHRPPVTVAGPPAHARCLNL